LYLVLEIILLENEKYLLICSFSAFQSLSKLQRP